MHRLSPTGPKRTRRVPIGHTQRTCPLWEDVRAAEVLARSFRVPRP